MFFKFNSTHLFLFVFCLNLKCVFTLDPPDPDHAISKEVTKEENIKTSTLGIGLDSVNAFKVNKKSDHVIEIPLGKPEHVTGEPENQGSVSNKGTSQLVLEGGGIVDLTSTALPNSSLLDIEKVDDGTNHSKGSKPRKGVQHPGSSVVPRKGVDPRGAFSFNQSSTVITGPIKESTSAISDKQMPLNKNESLKVNSDQQQVIEQSTTPKVPHPRKPVVVTDIEDVDDFEKYPIIQTSTTGEDYIIIGIVIVLGIWCSIFGALIFYRRAGEYWDRRHYRRMDFLVEGMYND